MRKWNEDWIKISEVQLHVFSPLTGLAINSATDASAISGMLQ